MAAESSTSQPFLRGLAVVLAPTLIVAFVSYVYTTLDGRRKERLAYVRGQIGDLYGPLYTLSTANQSVWKNLGRDRIPRFDDPQNPPAIDRVIVWRRLLANVVAPLNARMQDVLLSSKQTVRCADARKALLDFFAYAESVKLVTSTWKSVDDVDDKTMQSRDANIPELNYPNNLTDILSAELNVLHRQEAALDDGFFGLFTWRGGDEFSCAPTK